MPNSQHVILQLDCGICYAAAVSHSVGYAKGAGANILLHPMPQGRKEGQTLVKLVFDVEDVEEFCRFSQKRGLDFGAIHHSDGYSFANAKDPAKNSISVSSRAFVRR